MRNEIINEDQARSIEQVKKYGVISEGCSGVWGEGDSETEAIQNTFDYLITETPEKTSDEIDDFIEKQCWLTELIADEKQTQLTTVEGY